MFPDRPRLLNLFTQIYRLKFESFEISSEAQSWSYTHRIPVNSRCANQRLRLRKLPANA